MNALDGMKNESNAEESEEDRIGRRRWSIAVEGLRNGAIRSYALTRHISSGNGTNHARWEQL